MPSNEIITAYARVMSDKWDLVREKEKQLIESLSDNPPLLEGLPDDIVRNYIWPKLHNNILSSANTDADTLENIRLLFGLRSSNEKWRQVVNSSAMFGILKMLLLEFPEYGNPLTDPDGMIFFRRSIRSFAGVHVLGPLESEDLDQYRVNWNEYEPGERAFFMWEFNQFEILKLCEIARRNIS
ncbi:unnamed protein product [Calypogeia fissa]